MQLLLGDCLDQLKTLDENSIDSVVTDPPYFLTNSSGSGFMGKQWDSLSVKNAFAEAFLRSLSPVWIMAEENTVHESVSINSKNKKRAQFINARFVTKCFTGAQAKLNQSTFSVLDHVLTKAEVLALSKELCPSLMSVLEKSPENVLFVVPYLFTAKNPKGIAQELALKLHTNQLCEDLTTLRTLMEEVKTKNVTEATIGNKLERECTQETITSVKDVESIVAKERYNATTLLHIDLQKTINFLISSHYAKGAMALFMENPANIQILSERFHSRWLDEVYRVLKPGGHLLSFAGTRTYHPLARAAEMSGFEIRDQIMWLYGSGFPKSYNVSKGIDKKFGAERDIIGLKMFADGRTFKGSEKSGRAGLMSEGKPRGASLETSATTDQAKKWDGFGTALKPANEPIVLARKPLSEKTIVDNVLKWGTGALNIDGCRIGGRERTDYGLKNSTRNNKNCYGSDGKSADFDASQGRFPANIILDEEAGAALDEQAGQECSRFFYCAKASKAERGADNGHPTVKPIKLMTYLIRLVTPPGGTVLDPFMGSGSTGIAAKKEGMDFVGIELSEEYFDIAQRRIG